MPEREGKEKMRNFGNDRPEYFPFTLFEGKKVYKIPLATSIPAQELIDMQDAYAKGDEEAFKAQMEFLRKYIGDMADKLTAGDVREIIEAWGKASQEDGAEPGE